MKKLSLILSLLLLINCSGVEYRQARMKIVSSNLMADQYCDNAQTVTLLQEVDDRGNSNGRLAKICGYWGEKNQPITGFWVTGETSWGRDLNGFSLYKR